MVASILDMADGGRIFSISPAQARFNRESVAFFNASCGPLDRARRPACPRPITAMLSSASRCRTWCIAACSNRTALPSSPGESNKDGNSSPLPTRRSGPVNLATGPDGALYIVDMYRELVEHPQFVPESVRGAVDFRRWHDRGRIWRVRPRADRGIAE